MSERQPAEADWRRMAKLMGWGEVCADPECRGCGKPIVWRRGSGDLELYTEHGKDLFDPLHDERDLAWLVQAMQKQGASFTRRQHPYEGSRTDITIPGHDDYVAQVDGRTDLYATFWAIVEALEEKEKRDADTDG